jgi:hypothetical protein
MGLESLYLRTNETGEITYRLRLRVAKILSALGHDVYDMKKLINYAYETRSAYVHGDKLKSKTAKDIERNYGGLDNLFKKVADVLRISIVTNLLIGGGINKEDLITLIDDSFVGREKDDELRTLISPLSEIV